MTPEQYLALERSVESRNEYRDGEMITRSPSTRNHVALMTQLLGLLFQDKDSLPCQPYAVGLRVKVTRPVVYTYPDIVVTCGEEQFEDDAFDTLLNPTLLAEIVSPGTEAYDRGLKFEHYRMIESLKQYLLVSQDRVHVDLFTRQEGGQWLLTSASRLEDTVELNSIGCALPLADLYEVVKFE